MNLWPQEMTYSDQETPLSVIVEQASFLATKTEGIVIATVKNNNFSYKENFEYQFFIECKSLNYSYSIFQMNHGIDLYPIRFTIDVDIYGELSKQPSVSYKTFSQASVYVESEPELINLLSDIFKSQKVKKLVQSLQMQAKNETEHVMNNGINYEEVPF